MSPPRSQTTNRAAWRWILCQLRAGGPSVTCVLTQLVKRLGVRPVAVLMMKSDKSPASQI
jgi:hypothetical protein